MISHDILNERFLEVGMDILTFKGKDYLVVVDYYSKYPELLALPDKTASITVEQCKSVVTSYLVLLSLEPGAFKLLLYTFQDLLSCNHARLKRHISVIIGTFLCLITFCVTNFR